MFKRLHQSTRHHAKKIAWVSDTHLNYQSKSEFLRALNYAPHQAILHTGDINNNMHETYHFIDSLSQRQINKPFYFVLGNHDYYDEKSSIADTRRQFHELQNHNKHNKHKTTKYATWLNTQDYVALSEYQALTGVDGWPK